VHALEQAIAAATLAGRHATADRLRERLARERGNVVRLDDERGHKR
jgi:hypothetical protein